MAVKVEIVKVLERHQVESKGKPLLLVHALVKVRSESEDYVRLFVPVSVVLEEGREYSVLFNGIALRVKEEAVKGFGVPFDAKFPKPSGLP
jgi:hypothetical protein